MTASRTTRCHSLSQPRSRAFVKSPSTKAAAGPHLLVGQDLYQPVAEGMLEFVKGEQRGGVLGRRGAVAAGLDGQGLGEQRPFWRVFYAPASSEVSKSRSVA